MQTSNLTVTQFAKSIHIKNEEVEYFMIAWEDLMNKFNIPDEHQPALFHIMKNFFITLDADFETIYDLNNSLEAINFFISYREAADKIEAKYESSSPRFDELIKLQVLASNAVLPFNYPGITIAAVNLLYHFLKGNDVHLRYHFEPYDQLPPAEILIGIKDLLNHSYSYKYQLWLIDTVKQLKGYINANLAQPLVRKVNLFIFELLYLFDILQYAGKIDHEDSIRFKLNDNNIQAKFTSSVRIEDAVKTEVVTDIVVHAAKVAKYQETISDR